MGLMSQPNQRRCWGHKKKSRNTKEILLKSPRSFTKSYSDQKVAWVPNKKECNAYVQLSNKIVVCHELRWKIFNSIFLIGL